VNFVQSFLYLIASRAKVQASNIRDFKEKYEQYKNTKSKRLRETMDLAIKLKSGKITLKEAGEIAEKKFHKSPPKKGKITPTEKPKKIIFDPSQNKFNIKKVLRVVSELQHTPVRSDNQSNDDDNEHYNSTSNGSLEQMSKPTKKIKTEYSEDSFVKRHDPTQIVYDFKEFQEDLEFEIIVPKITADPLLLEEEGEQDLFEPLIPSPSVTKWRKRLDMLINDLVYEPRPLRCYKTHFVMLGTIFEEIRNIQPDVVSLLHAEIFKKITYLEKLIESYARDQEVKDLEILKTLKDFQYYFKQDLINQAFDASRLEQKFDIIIRNFVD